MTSRVHMLVDSMDRDSFLTLYRRNSEYVEHLRRNLEKGETLLARMREAGTNKFGLTEDEL